MSTATDCKTISVPAAAKRLGVAPGKILYWIKESGELRARNLARSRTGRPRYGIRIEDLEAFERAREVIPSGGGRSQKLRRRAAGTVKSFF